MPNTNNISSIKSIFGKKADIINLKSDIYLMQSKHLLKLIPSVPKSIACGNISVTCAKSL
jgi:hypothetical protein